MDYKGIKALVMGLGLHGGGLASAKFLLKRGADVTVTDLRDEKTLLPSIKELGHENVRYVLGKHKTEDFEKADIVIKNPGVRPDSKFLKVSKRIETDLSLFLSESPARLFAVTGTKGKSGTASALHWILKTDRKTGKAYLGGNITVSPLTFLDELTEADDVVLELSSFQLGDIKKHQFKPAAAILTSIMHDHQDRYSSMEEYIDDKRNIYRGQDANCITVVGDDSWGKSFFAETKGRPIVWYGKQGLASPPADKQSGGWIDSGGRGLARLYNWPDHLKDKMASEEIAELVPAQVLTPGAHQKQNMLCAALAAYGVGLKAETIYKALAEYPGIEHRLELFHKKNDVRFFNDSAATIPEAAAACIEALSAEVLPQGGIVLVTGGTDKNLDFTRLADAVKKVKEIVLLAGTGSDKLMSLLNAAGIKYNGPFDDFEKAVLCAVKKAAAGDIVALSPGCASFGMFLNEFDRGRQWKEAIKRLG